VRRLLLPALVAALVVPAAALATSRAVDDGTLVVKNGDGFVFVSGRGAIIGSCDQCRVRTYDPDPDDGTGPIVAGAEDHADVSEGVDLYTGTDVRFRMIGGAFKVRITGSGIDLGVVAKGWGRIKASDSNTGWYSLNGGDRRQLPDEIQKFTLITQTD
jgi:hypothetical protein